MLFGRGRKKKFYPLKLKKGATITLSTKDSVPSLGGNLLLKTVTGKEKWFSINKGATKNKITLDEDVYQFKNLLEGTIEYQLEIGSVATSYEPYKSNILTVNENVTLRGIGDVKDTLDLMTGEVAQNIYEFTLDGSQNIDSDGKLLYYYLPFGVQTNSSNSDNFPSITVAQILDGLSGIATQNRGNASRIYVNINGITTKEDMKKFFLNNPTTIQCVLTEKSVKTVDLTVTDQNGNAESNIRPFEGTMHIMTNGTPIKPTATIEVPVEAITQNLMSFANIEEEE